MHLGEPLRVRGVASPLASTLASGYPLHHLHTCRFAPSMQVVPLLSLSLRRKEYLTYYLGV
jgi:hypothetical protein